MNFSIELSISKKVRMFLAFKVLNYHVLSMTPGVGPLEILHIPDQGQKKRLVEVKKVRKIPTESLTI